MILYIKINKHEQVRNEGGADLIMNLITHAEELKTDRQQQCDTQRPSLK